MVTHTQIKNVLKSHEGVSTATIARELKLGYAMAGRVIGVLKKANRITEDYDAFVGGFRVLGRGTTTRAVDLLDSSANSALVAQPANH